MYEMNATRRIVVGAAAVIAVAAMAFAAGAAVGDGTPTAASSPIETAVAQEEPSSADESPTAIEVSAAELSKTEAEGLAFMREEEKLARDVYLTLADVWGARVFTNIAKAEQTHMDAMLDLIDGYGLEDPVGGNAIGVFEDAGLQKMFDELVATGSESLEAALGVGGLIEEVDIEDLVTYLESTDASDVVNVYQQLLSGSENHLRAFVSQLQKAGVDYEPSVLGDEQFDSIIASTNERGHGGESHGGQRGGQHGRNGAKG